MDYKKIRISAWDLHNEEIEDLIKKIVPEEIEFFWVLEFEISITESLIEFINQNKINIKVITCLGELDPLKNKIYSKFNPKYTRVEVWPMFWFSYSHMRLLNENSLYTLKELDNKKFKNPFLTFNGRERPHRSILIDKLKKYNLLDKGVVTFHRSHITPESHPGNFEYYDGSVIAIDDGFNTGNNFKFNRDFLESFLHIPTESITDNFLISEKTATPMLCKLPFLVLGCPYYHQKLKKLGFELYTEIFDYSFDLEKDLKKRIEKLMYNIMYVTKNKHRLNEFYKIIEPKVEKNYQLIKKHIESFDLLPDMAKDFYNQTSDSYYVLSNIESILNNLSVFFKDKDIKKI